MHSTQDVVKHRNEGEKMKKISICNVDSEISIFRDKG